MKKLALVTILATVIAQPVMANKEILSCITKNGKHLSLVEKGKYLEYSFGKLNQKPELTFKNDTQSVYQRSNNGYWYEVFEMKNGKYFYSVIKSWDPEYSPSHVEVTKNGKTIARIDCANK